ncbi:hypothetical protein VK792_19365 [Mesobacterium sp. TK19101]|uniref:Uncharacterized protein n=1 Tax=Mesobacterium hydrothermale TaxID=3111907 RepID=A0ABU6HLW8_9RHOB|nr:hypothetical protein [Mesobacterium sp. TK19101]MEC3863445.1 hypothetical protein [Mesobacterium sp. TK19101]
MSELIGYAGERRVSLRISSGKVNVKCYSEQLTAQVIQIMDKGCEIHLVVTSSSEAEIHENKFAKAISSHRNGHVYVLPTGRNDAELSHFAVAGDRAFRFETNHDTAEAYLSFNRPDIARSLVSLHQDYVEICEEHIDLKISA